jgi:hypothetical protein
MSEMKEMRETAELAISGNPGATVCCLDSTCFEPLNLYRGTVIGHWYQLESGS